MSFNIQIRGKRNATVTVNGKTIEEVQTVNFNQWQTPTKVTEEILGSENPLQAYIDWVKKSWKDEVQYLDEEDKIWLDTDKDYIVTNNAKEHLEELEKFLNEVKEGQYKLDIFGF
tara:strand:- start:1613 stop:1957 length:345 start_codon:yes stop_codon:yes gene_type:complete